MEPKEILVVDDEPMILELYGDIFGGAGYVVRTARSAEEALAMLQERPSWVMFLDLNLPGMNGLELCRQVRSHWPMAIAYAVTGYASLFQLSECRDAGFEDYFTKPASISDLLRAAERAWEKLSRWRRGSAATAS